MTAGSSGPLQTIDNDLQDAFAAEASANESAILAWADGLVASGSHSLGDALAAGFKAKVPLAGGSIGAAVEVALAQLDVTADSTLKTQFDALIAAAQAHQLKVPL